MIDSIREWIVGSLPWIVVALLALWLPPVLFAVGVDLLATDSRGYPRLTDPALLLPIVELTLMATAVPALVRRSSLGWRLAAWSRGVVLAQTLWTVAIESRLSGLGRTMLTRTVVEAVAGLVIAALLLAFIRSAYGSLAARRPGPANFPG